MRVSIGGRSIPRVGPESNAPTVWSGWGDQPPDRLEDDPELLVKPPFELIEPASQVLVRSHQMPKLHERPHDLDIDADRLWAVEDA